MRPSLERLCCRVEHKWGPYEEKYGMMQSDCQRESCIALRRITKGEYHTAQMVRRGTEAQLLALNRYQFARVNPNQGDRGIIKWRRYGPVTTETA